MFSIRKINKGDQILQRMMQEHYSQPKGFVGRQLFYHIFYEDRFYGCIAFGSATLHLPGRNKYPNLNNGMNNIFYHIQKLNNKYPCRNFTTKALLAAEPIAINDWCNYYRNEVYWLESLVELPRTGDLYKKAGYINVGITKGYTCKRIAGKGTDSWGGQRVWDRINLRPKLVFIKELK